MYEQRKFDTEMIKGHKGHVCNEQDWGQLYHLFLFRLCSMFRNIQLFKTVVKKKSCNHHVISYKHSANCYTSSLNVTYIIIIAVVVVMAGNCTEHCTTKNNF